MCMRNVSDCTLLITMWLNYYETDVLYWLETWLNLLRDNIPVVMNDYVHILIPLANTGSY